MLVCGERERNAVNVNAKTATQKKQKTAKQKGSRERAEIE